jgi:hypothetical protein
MRREVSTVVTSLIVAAAIGLAAWGLYLAALLMMAD